MVVQSETAATKRCGKILLRAAKCGGCAADASLTRRKLRVAVPAAFGLRHRSIGTGQTPPASNSELNLLQDTPGTSWVFGFQTVPR
jgi:hypothetical protein